MGHASESKRMDTTSYTTVKLNKHILFGMSVAAIENYPRESMGLVTFWRRKRTLYLGTVVPFASAERIGYMGIRNSKRSWKVYDWADDITQVVDGWHTHPSFNTQPLIAYPSKEDIADMEIGEFELILAFKPLHRRTVIPWRRDHKGL